MLETLITSGLILAVCGGVAAAVWQRMVREVTVFEYERGLRFVEGRFHDLLGPGRYRWSKRSTTIQKADLRVQTTTLIGQEVLSADAITLKVSITNPGAVQPAPAANPARKQRPHRRDQHNPRPAAAPGGRPRGSRRAKIGQPIAQLNRSGAGSWVTAAPRVKRTINDDPTKPYRHQQRRL
jgi:hypothetical protein